MIATPSRLSTLHSDIHPQTNKVCNKANSNTIISYINAVLMQLNFSLWIMSPNKTIV